jgi:DNA polymerase-3 subunit alpha
MNRRDEVSDYVTDKYGKDNVGQIVTMHQIKARSGVRDIARAMACGRRRRQVAKFVPEPIQGKSAADRRGDREGAAAQGALRREPDYRTLLDHAKAELEG